MGLEGRAGVGLEGRAGVGLEGRAGVGLEGRAGVGGVNRDTPRADRAAASRPWSDAYPPHPPPLRSVTRMHPSDSQQQRRPLLRVRVRG